MLLAVYLFGSEAVFILLLKIIFGMHNEATSNLAMGFKATFVALLVLKYWLRKLPLCAITNHFTLPRQSKATDAVACVQSQLNFL